MTRKRTIKRIGAFLLLAVILITSLFIVQPTAAITWEQYIEQAVKPYASIVESVLTDAISKKANALETAGNTADAAHLRSFDFYPFRLALLEAYYAQVYVKEYVPITAAADDMADYLATGFYLDRLTTPELVTDALVICYMRGAGDTYASYVSEADYFAATEEENGNYVGIGVTVELTDDGYAHVIEVAHGSPAEGADIRIGDIITAVGEEDFAKIGYDAAIDLIRGAEGSSVTITVKRGDASLEKTMIRKKMTIYSVTYRLVEQTEEKIGLVRITKFDKSTFSQFVTAMEALEAEGATSYIFDVRRNPGGNLDAVLAVLEYILPDNTGAPLVRLSYKDKTNNYYSIKDYYGGSLALVEENGYAKALNHSIDKKMTVLCDSYTISAGELFASCMKDFGAAELYGEQTYGKGMGQSALLLRYDYAGNAVTKEPYGVIRISTFYYAPPVSDNYEGAGVTPHHTVSLPEELATENLVKLTEEQDTQLQAAVAFIESGAPVSAGKVDLSGGGDTGGGDTGGDTGDGGGDAISPDTPSQTLPNDEKPEKISTYKIVFWIVFGALAVPSVSLLIFFGVYHIIRKKKETDTSFFDDDSNGQAD